MSQRQLERTERRESREIPLPVFEGGVAGIAESIGGRVVCSGGRVGRGVEPLRGADCGGVRVWIAPGDLKWSAN